MRRADAPDHAEEVARARAELRATEAFAIAARVDAANAEVVAGLLLVFASAHRAAAEPLGGALAELRRDAGRSDAVSRELAALGAQVEAVRGLLR